MQSIETEYEYNEDVGEKEEETFSLYFMWVTYIGFHMATPHPAFRIT